MSRTSLLTILAMTVVASTAWAQASSRSWDFKADKPEEPPAGFSFARTGSGRPGKWVVKTDATAPRGDHVLVQVDTDDTDYRFPVAVAEAPLLKDVRVEVRCKPVAGKTDQACGLVARYRDADNYYIARANALEDNVRLYRVVKGERHQLASWSGKVAADVWHELGLEVRVDALRVYWEGKPILEARDDTFTGPGKVGVWTKADSVTHFAGLRVTPLP